jgi:hypothetical protein
VLAAQPVHGEFAQQVQDDHDDERIRRIAVQAAHDAGGIPLIVGHVFDRRKRFDDSGIEKYVQVDAGSGGDPVEIPAECAKPGERVVALAERVLEYALCFAKNSGQRLFYESHDILIRRCAIP